MDKPWNDFTPSYDIVRSVVNKYYRLNAEDVDKLTQDVITALSSMRRLRS